MVMANRYSSSGCGVALLGVDGGAFGSSGVGGGVHVTGKFGLGVSSKSSVDEDVVTVDSSEMSEVMDDVN